jgi:hypothetical protein
MINKKYSSDYGDVNRVKNQEYIKPKSINELSKFIIHNYYGKQRQLCIKGAGYSHGGHTLLENGIQIDMININHIKYINDDYIIVGGGCKWYDIIKFLLKYNKTLECIQSYYNFSVGGSISVNCHGRNTHKTISDTIKSLTIMLSTGEIIKCDRINNYELFKGSIGGYGLLGIIIEAEIYIINNEIIECTIIKNTLKNIYFPDKNYFQNNDVVYYNTIIYPKTNKYVHCIWKKTKSIKVNKLKKIKEPKDQYYISPFMEQLLRRFDIIKQIRPYYDNLIMDEFNNSKISIMSYEIADDVNILKPLSHHPTTTILQEYFIPISRIYDFLNFFNTISYNQNILNISVRYVNKINDSILNYAPIDSYAIVLYINIYNNNFGLNKLKLWTNKLLEKTIELSGKFYLPYLKVYDIKYINMMYDLNKIFLLKKKYDKYNIFKNFLEN